ncbi:SRPBCC family protein [Rhodococcus sp. IEGM 1379]|uniref:SRPBCC family protein n=1 Tax=Rhodococcus sp. IEGM 1379 TaxID=3047086 RepID=UPI0024B6A276|nr:SRPBCC family protein [Rhodococcus sp. IEGM 1379]MDI9914086.1 SRPBCC family protein [Rhodococcus sp. IEGM 1379]
MIHVRHSAVAAVPVDVAFAYIDDYRNVPTWMFGVSEFTPSGEFDQGLGASFDAAMQIGPSTLRSNLEVTEWEKNRIITLSSLGGVSNSSTWEFTAVDDSKTELSVDFAYKISDGLAGKALGMLIGPFIENAVRNSEETLRRRLEAEFAAHGKS